MFRSIAIFVGTAGLLVAGCKDVQGKLDEKPVLPPQCSSPVALCTASQISGPVKGDAAFTASAIISSADAPVTGVVFVIGNVLVSNVQFEGKRGTLTLKSAAAFGTLTGSIVDNQTIVSGTGDFAGAHGFMRLTGTFGPTGGTSHYEGTICTP